MRTRRTTVDASQSKTDVLADAATMARLLARRPLVRAAVPAARPPATCQQPDRDNGTSRPDLLPLLQDATIEVFSRRRSSGELAGHIKTGSEMFVSCLPGDTWRDLTRTVAVLSEDGFQPVPHVPVRRFTDQHEAGALLSALTAAGANRVLLVAGDSTAVGCAFPSTLHLLESGLLSQSGIRSVYVAGHPEGSAYQDADQALAFLERKVAAARRAILEIWVVTQFCFASTLIVRWLEAYRDRGLSAPVKIGLAGPGNATALLHAALRCGVGDPSIATLQQRFGTLQEHYREVVPEDVIFELAPHLTSGIGHPVATFHIYPVGGLTRTLAWRNSLCHILRAAAMAGSQR